MLVLAFGVCGLRPAAAAEGTANVLVVYSQGRLLPANIQIDTGLNESNGRPDRGADVAFFAEFLGNPVFSGEAYETQTASYLRHKYATRPPRVIVAAGYIALGFLVRYRDSMFPGVPIVFTAVDKNYLVKMGSMPPGVTGIPVGYDVGATIDLAVRLHPDARRLVIVNGWGEWAQVRETEAREAVAQRRLPMPVEYIGGLSTEALLTRLRTLPPGSVIFTQGYFLDGAGKSSTPLESIQQMLRVSPAPIYTVYASQLGSGVVGGSMSSFTDMGRQARLVVREILEGKPGAANAIRPALAAPAQVDWRALQKWDIPMDRIPADAMVHFRKPSIWELYRVQAIVAVLVLLAQSGLIAALLIERRRRRRTARALEDSERHISVAAKAARLSTFAWDFGDDGAASDTQKQSSSRRVEDHPQLHPLLESVHPDDRERLLSATRDTLDNAAELNLEFRALGPGGEVRWTAMRGQSVNGAGQKIAGVSMDISERKRTEFQAASDRAALTHLSRVSIMGQLSAAIAHQLNQPLASILTNAETARKMLDCGEPSPNDLREILDDIVTEDSRAADIIRHLAALYRRSPSTRTTFSLNDLVKETLELLRAEMTLRHVTTRVELAADLPAIDGSRIQLQQVILNLVINAAEAMAEQQDRQHTLLIRTTLDEAQVHLHVTDQGPGIAQEASERIFDPFWSSKSQGLGVGLAICRAIIEAHDGTIEAVNNPEGGATFWFGVPMVERSQ